MNHKLRLVESAVVTAEHMRVDATDVKLRESDGKKGIWEIRIIEAGEGSSGYYPAEMLERDGAKAFPKGTRMFANHDGWEDMFSGGDIRRLMGKTLSDATYRDGALWTEAKFGKDWIEWMEEYHEAIGVSISTSGESEIGTVDEFTGPVITHLENDAYTSVDVVVAPGAGGAVTRMLESAKRIVENGATKDSVEPSVEVKKENEVELKDIKEALEESNKSLVSALIEALKPAPAEGGEVDFAAAAEAVVAEESLAPSGRKRVFEALKAGVPLEKALAEEKKIADEYAAKFTESDKIKEAEGRVVESASDKGDSIAASYGFGNGAN